MKKYLIVIAFTVVAISWLMLIPVGVKQSYMQVKAFKASTSDVVTTVDCQGTLEAASQKQIIVGVPVKISKNYFNIGDKVKKGDKLLEIDRDVTLQTLAYSTAESTSSISANSSSNSQITEDDAENALEQALSTGIIGQSTYDSLLNQINNSSGSSLSLPSSTSSSAASKTETDNEKTIDSVENSLFAPISGVITDISDGTTGISPAASALATIVDMSSVQVKAQVSEENVKSVKVGQQVHISGTGFSGTYTGVVKQIYPVVKSVSTLSGSSNTVDIIVSIDKADANLLPGLTANVTIKVSEQRGIVTLPYDSIKQDDDGTEYVYVFKNGCAVKRKITTGTEDDNGVEVLKGVSRGEIIIEDESDTVTNGTNVRVN
jgi:RND family efflux transporter MFP subunit